MRGTAASGFVEDVADDRVLFEAISAFRTVGLSTGIAADLPPGGVLLLVVLMLAGRPTAATPPAPTPPRTRRTTF
ncbi:potassium transporter TrkG [Micromonosporaceae bacterium B7E4]